MTQPTPTPAPTTTKTIPTLSLNSHTVASVLETLGFLIAVVLQVLHDPHFAAVSALGAASMHAYNH